MLNIFRKALKYLIPEDQGHLEKYSTEILQIVPCQAKFNRISTGYKFTEGPVWIKEIGCLLFSDIPANRIYKLDLNGEISIYREPSNHSNGLTLDVNGRLIACEHGTRSLSRTETDSSITILAGTYKGKKLNSPNDVIVRNNGLIYFTDPAFGIRKEQQEQEHNGVYLLNPETSRLTLVSSDFERPNGLSFSPCETYLYVDDSWKKWIIRYKVKVNGELEKGELFYEFKEQAPGNPDGMKVDVDGNIYCTGPGGISVISASGKLLGKLVLPEIPSNCAWGGIENKTLFITAQTSVYKVDLKIAGISA